MSKNDLFVFDDDEQETNNKTITPDSNMEQAHQQEEPLHMKTATDKAQQSRHDEQYLTMIAINAAPARWLWRRARRAAFDVAMQQLKYYIGPEGCDTCPKQDCELSAYCRFLQQLLRL